MAFAPKQVFHQRLNARHAGLSANQHHFIYLAGVNAGVFHALLARTDRALNDVFNHPFELRPGQLLHQMLGTAGVGGDERQIDLRLHGGGELDLGALGCITQTLQRHLVALAAQVEAFVFLEFVDEPVHQPLVDIVAAEVSVTVGGFHFNHAFSDFQHRNIESSAAEVVHGDGFVLAFVEAIGERGRCRLVDDAFDVETGDLAGIFGGLPLRVVEVRGDGNHSSRHLLAQVRLGRFLQLAENHGRDLGRGVLFALAQDDDVISVALDLVGDHLHFFVDFVEAASHEPLDRINRVLRVGDGLPLRHLPNQPLAVLGECDHRRRSAASFFICDKFGFPPLHDCDAGVGGSKVNSNNLCHIRLLNSCYKCFKISVLSIALLAIMRVE